MSDFNYVAVKCGKVLKKKWWQDVLNIHCKENHIFSFQTSWKDGLSKTIALEFDISYIIGNYDISFSWEHDLTPRRKMKDDLSQKNTRKYNIFFKWSKEMVFSKRTAPGHDLSCTIWKGGIFSRKHGIFSLDGKRKRDDLSQEIHGNMIFSIWYVPRPPAKKKLKTILSRKNTPKGDWHSRSAP